jgi:peptidoglycan/LPS O-acetylase OafA/YrhL
MKFSMKPYLPALVVCVILFIAVFLPWLTVDMGGLMPDISENGINDWGYLVLVMSIIGVIASFISVPRTRSLSEILTGILAIVGSSVYWSRLQGAGAGYGLIIALIASLGLIAVGYMEYRQLGQSSKSDQPPPANPPAPPPPAQ